MKIKIKKLKPGVVIPAFSYQGDAGLDLFSAEKIELAPGQRHSVGTGIAIKIPAGYAGLIWDKSGISHKNGIKVLGGVIDSNYTGEWKVGLVNLGQVNYSIEAGDKIAQVLFQKVEAPEIELVEELEETARGEKGFGSSGK